MILNGKIAILMGGPSAEASVSRVSAKCVFDALQDIGQKCTLIELDDVWIQTLKSMQPKFVFNALHGVPGEDGSVQGVLDLLNMPYQGSGLLASALAMDKEKSKILFKNNGINVALQQIIKVKNGVPSTQKCTLPLPVVVKPSCGGSSVATFIIKETNQFALAIQKAAKFGTILVEEYIPGRELTVGVFKGESQGIVEILPQGHGFYDYESKYSAGGSKHKISPELPESIEKKCMQWAKTAHKCLECTGAKRVDFRYDEASRNLVVLEVNTLPGLTPVSLLPDVAKGKGISFVDLIKWMIEDGLQNWESLQTAQNLKEVAEHGDSTR